MTRLITLNEELASLRQCIQHDEDARAQAWASFDDEDEALLELSIQKMQARVYEIEQILEAHC